MSCKFRQPKATHFDFDSNVKKIKEKLLVQKKAQGVVDFRKEKENNECV